MGKPNKYPKQDIANDEPLTQYGERPPGCFRDRLRPWETEMSLVLGDIDTETVTRLVTRSTSTEVTSIATRRVTKAGTLRAHGFRVEHSPSKANRRHVSVYPPLDDTGEPAEWDDKMAAVFNECFTTEDEMEGDSDA